MARKTQFLTKEIEAAFAKTGSQEGKGDQALVIAKYFHPSGRYTLYATEYDPTSRLFFGYTINHAQEWGDTSLDEMAGVVVRGLQIERDLHWTPVTIKEAVEKDAGIEYAPGRQV